MILQKFGTAKKRALLHKYQLILPNFKIGNLELTNRCPFTCIMCVRTYGMKRDQGDMTEELFKKIIDDYAKTSPKNFAHEEFAFTHFGESLLNKDFSTLIRYAVDSGAKNTFISINPLMLTEKVINGLIESRVSKIHLSLDGHDDETFEKIRGIPKAYERSKERLLEFIEKLKEVESSYRPYIRLGMVNFKENSESIEKAEVFWKTITRIDEFWTKPVFAWSGSEKEVNEFAKFDVQSYTKVTPTCKLPWHNLTVLFDGRVVPCCSDHDGKYVLGDLNHQTLDEIWNGEPIQNLRKEMLSKNVTNDLCKNCQLLGDRS